MKKKYIRIQWIPDDSGKIKNFKLPTWLWKVIKVFFIIFIIIVILFLLLAGNLAKKALQLEEVKKQNTILLEKQAKYEEYFESLDSLFLIDLQIQNILGLFIENDTSKINKILDKNRLSANNPVKNEIDFEGRYGWRPLSEKIKAEKIPDVIPVSGVISKNYSEKEKHFGVDFAAKNDDPVYASASGVVISVNETEDLGLTIQIDHQNGYKTSYSHLSKANVKEGKKISKGDIIGSVGSTGKTSGPHLHYVIQKDGRYINPETYFNF
ncbi:MAG: M23 family metallopeptidase [Fibrobacteraceae bacterium]|nr:M23 family metallopeptidase [Fibrobacteraceae bacterium]